MASRVLILSWEYPPVVEGGLSRHVEKLAKGLVGRGIEVHVLTRGGGGLARREERRGVWVHRVDEPRRPTGLDRFVPWVQDLNVHLREAGEALAARVGFDVLHGHDWLVASAAVRLAEHANLPYLTTIHATEHGRHQGWVDAHPQAHVHGVEAWMARRAQGIVVCSDYMRGHVADVFGVDRRRISVIANGVEVPVARPVEALAELRARYAAPDERLVLLAGRLVYEKGVQLALDALGGPAGVIEHVGDVRFVVAGSGPHEAALRAQAEELGIAEHGTFLGWIGAPDLDGLYAIADLTVVPSLYEPFGLVALEAMAAGCPCVAADTGGLREVVPTSAGLRFAAGDVRSLRRTIERVLTEDSLREHLKAAGAEHVRHFDWADVARRTSAVYASLTAGPGT